MCQPPIAQTNDRQTTATQCRCGFPIRIEAHRDRKGLRWAQVFALKALCRVQPGDRIYQCPCCTQDFRDLPWDEAQRRFSEGFGA
jgi:hypothetical protein